MMRKTLQLLACAAVLAAPLAFTTAAVAEPNDEMESAAPAQTGEHQKYNEQWEQLRAEHDALVAERDRLMERCMDAKGQDKSACDEHWKDLHERHDAWRERMMAFHGQNNMDKHAEHKGHHHHHKGMMKPGTKDGAKPEHHGEGKHHHHAMKPAPAAPSAPASTDQ